MKRILAALIALGLALSLCGCAPVQAQSFALDTVITVSILSGGGQDDAQAALARIDACERLLSAHRAGSDVWTINQSGGQPVAVEELTARVLSRALDIGAQTGGALDITLLSASRLWDYKSDSPRVPTRAELDAALEDRGMERIAVEGGIVRAERVQVDLGAVAKGAIGDEAVAELKARGVRCALLNLGGNILTLGDKPDGSAWTVAIESPFGGGTVGVLSFSGSRAVATSSGAQRYFELDGVRYHHILDPETGMPAASGLASVTVLADDGLTADALSTALFVAGEEEAERIVAHYGCAAVLVRDDGTVRTLGDAAFTAQ